MVTKAFASQLTDLDFYCRDLVKRNSCITDAANELDVFFVHAKLLVNKCREKIRVRKLNSLKQGCATRGPRPKILGPAERIVGNVMVETFFFGDQYFQSNISTKIF